MLTCVASQTRSPAQPSPAQPSLLAPRTRSTPISKPCASSHMWPAAAARCSWIETLHLGLYHYYHPENRLECDGVLVPLHCDLKCSYFSITKCDGEPECDSPILSHPVSATKVLFHFKCIDYRTKIMRSRTKPGSFSAQCSAMKNFITLSVL